MSDYELLVESKQGFLQRFQAALRFVCTHVLYYESFKHDLLDFINVEYVLFYREAEENTVIDNNACLSIQRVYRGTVSRERIAKKR
jgi:hypothetical protein